MGAGRAQNNTHRRAHQKVVRPCTDLCGTPFDPTCCLPAPRLWKNTRDLIAHREAVAYGISLKPPCRGAAGAVPGSSVVEDRDGTAAGSGAKALPGPILGEDFPGRHGASRKQKGQRPSMRHKGTPSPEDPLHPACHWRLAAAGRQALRHAFRILKQLVVASWTQETTTLKL